MASTKVANSVMTTDGQKISANIYNHMSAAVRDIVPEPTADNAREFGAAIMNYEPAANEYIWSLVNRIAFTMVRGAESYDSLSELRKGEMAFGKTIQEVYVDLLNPTEWDATADYVGELFSYHSPNVQTLYHSINFNKQVPVSVKNDMLKRAFLSWEGVEDLTGWIVRVLYESMSAAEFEQMKNLLALGLNGGYMYPVTIAPIADEKTAKDAMISIKSISGKLSFLSRDYNYAGVATRSTPDYQYLITTPEVNARLDVDVLAKAYNMSRAEFSGHIILVDDFGATDNVAAIMIDKEWYQVYDNMRRMTNAENASGLFWNYFYTVSMIFSFSHFRPAVAFVTEKPTITAVTLPEGLKVAKGGDIQIVPTVTGTGHFYRQCKYTVSGAESKKTQITSSGLLHIGPDEKAANVTVKATSTMDKSKSDTKTVTIEG